MQALIFCLTHLFEPLPGVSDVTHINRFQLAS
jgi:hypothetical protein